MTNNQQQQSNIWEAEGFRLTETGGGCTAYILGEFDAAHILITQPETASIQADHSGPVCLGFYPADETDAPCIDIACHLDAIKFAKHLMAEFTKLVPAEFAEGEQVKIKPEWQDEGDEDLTWRIKRIDGNRVWLQVDQQADMPIQPTFPATTKMIEKV